MGGMAPRTWASSPAASLLAQPAHAAYSVRRFFTQAPPFLSLEFKNSRIQEFKDSRIHTRHNARFTPCTTRARHALHDARFSSRARQALFTHARTAPFP